jgi:hypothetical protein
MTYSERDCHSIYIAISDILQNVTNRIIIATSSQMETLIVEYLFAIQLSLDTMVIIEQSN